MPSTMRNVYLSFEWVEYDIVPPNTHWPRGTILVERDDMPRFSRRWSGVMAVCLSLCGIESRRIAVLSS